MKKFLFVFIATLSFYFSIAQVSDADKNAALQTVSTNQKALGLSADDLSNLEVSNSYIDNTTGIRYVYLQQTYKGIPVFNQLQVLSFRDNKLLSHAGERIGSMQKLVNVNTGLPAITAESAVQSALSDRGLRPAQMASQLAQKIMDIKLNLETWGYPVKISLPS